MRPPFKFVFSKLVFSNIHDVEGNFKFTSQIIWIVLRTARSALSDLERNPFVHGTLIEEIETAQNPHNTTETLKCPQAILHIPHTLKKKLVASPGRDQKEYLADTHRR